MIANPTKQIAVIGGGIAGLVAAGEMALCGHDVSLFEAHALGGKAQAVRLGDVTLDAGPTLLTMPQIITACFSRLLARDLMPQFLELETQCHYKWPSGAQFQVDRSLEKTISSAEALYGGAGAELSAFYHRCKEIYEVAGVPYLEAPFRGIVDLMKRVAKRGTNAVRLGLSLGSLHGLARTSFQRPMLAQFAGRFATYAGVSPFDASASFALIAHVEQAFGVFHPRGGMGALAQALAQAVRRLGVSIHVGNRATWRRQRDTLVVSFDGHEERFDRLIVNEDPLVSMRRTNDACALSGYVLQLEFNRRLSLPHHSILFSQNSEDEFAALEGGTIADGSTMYVCHPSATDNTMAASHRSGVYVMLNAPPIAGDGSGRPSDADRRHWRHKSTAIRDECLHRLRIAYPEVASCSLIRSAELTPVDFADKGAPRGSIYGFRPAGRFGPFMRPAPKSSVPGVFYAGGGTHPGGGVPLVMLSGQFTSQLVQESFGRRRLFAQPSAAQLGLPS